MRSEIDLESVIATGERTEGSNRAGDFTSIVINLYFAFTAASVAQYAANVDDNLRRCIGFERVAI